MFSSVSDLKMHVEDSACLLKIGAPKLPISNVFWQLCNCPTTLTENIFALKLGVVNPLPSARQHPSYGDCLEVNREYYQCSVLDCVTQCSQSTAHLCEQFFPVGLTDWVCHIGTLTLCVEAVAQSCIIVTWWSGSDGIQAWSLTSSCFPSVLWHCGFGHLACKNCPWNDLLCVEWDVIPYTLKWLNKMELVFGKQGDYNCAVLC